VILRTDFRLAYLTGLGSKVPLRARRPVVCVVVSRHDDSHVALKTDHAPNRVRPARSCHAIRVGREIDVGHIGVREWCLSQRSSSSGST
jgi:hypothetical protein